MYRTILFDFDGTLTPSLDCWLSAFVFALDRYGVTLDEGEIIRRCFYRPYADVVADLQLPSSDELRDLVYEGLDIAFRDAILFPGVLSLLRDLRDRAKNLGIVTSSPRAVVSEALESLGIASFFGAVVSCDDCDRHKPDPAPLMLALERLGRGTEDAIYIGDYIVDVQAGRAAGMGTALHLPERHTRFYDFDRLRSTQPDFIFTEYSELSEYLLSPGLAEPVAS